MITLTLLHPTQSMLVRSWTFEPTNVTQPTPMIRVGRSNDNDIVIYSRVVSRRHLEVWYDGEEWELHSLGSNGTYIDDQQITKASVVDGMVIRLGISGPKLEIRLGSVDPNVPVIQLNEKQSAGLSSDVSSTFLTSQKPVTSNEGPHTDIDLRP